MRSTALCSNALRIRSFFDMGIFTSLVFGMSP
jgi:hypothetical protein